MIQSSSHKIHYDLSKMGEKDDRYTALADIVDAHKGLWCPEAEEYLLAHFEQE